MQPMWCACRNLKHPKKISIEAIEGGLQSHLARPKKLERRGYPVQRKSSHRMVKGVTRRSDDLHSRYIEANKRYDIGAFIFLTAIPGQDQNSITNWPGLNG
jgi:hypothetical protein